MTSIAKDRLQFGRINPNQTHNDHHTPGRDCNTNTNTNTKSQYLGPQYQYQYQYYQNFDPQYQYQYLDPSIPIPEGSIPQKWY